MVDRLSGTMVCTNATAGTGRCSLRNETHPEILFVGTIPRESQLLKTGLLPQELRNVIADF